MPLEQVSVIGGGAWGTALAQASAMAGRTVSLVVRDAAQVAEINTDHTNRSYLGLQKLHPAITAQHALGAADIVILAVPAQASRGVLAALDPNLLAGRRV